MTDAIPQTTSAPLSEGQRIVDTFVAPSKTFTDILRSSSWWGPLVIMLVVSIAFSFSVQTKVGWDRVFENNLHRTQSKKSDLLRLHPIRWLRLSLLAQRSPPSSPTASPS